MHPKICYAHPKHKYSCWNWVWKYPTIKHQNKLLQISIKTTTKWKEHITEHNCSISLVSQPWFQNKQQFLHKTSYARFTEILPTFYNCLSLSDKTYCLPSLGYLNSPYKPLYQKATKQQIKISYFEQWDNSCWSLARRISPASQPLYALFLRTNSTSLKTDEIQTIALLLGWRDGCTTSNAHLHLHSLKPITRLPRTATRIPPEPAKVRVCWTPKRPREHPELRSRKLPQLTQLFTSFISLHQTAKPVVCWLSYFTPIWKIQRLMRLDMTWNHMLNDFKASLYIARGLLEHFKFHLFSC